MAYLFMGVSGWGGWGFVCMFVGTEIKVEHFFGQQHFFLDSIQRLFGSHTQL